MNNGALIIKGLLERLAKAQYPGQIIFLLAAIWDASKLPMTRARG